jgi:hypothetical protein
MIPEACRQAERTLLTRREQNVIDLTLNSAEGLSWPLALVNRR